MTDISCDHADLGLESICEAIRGDLAYIVGDIEFRPSPPSPPARITLDTCSAIVNRIEAICSQLISTVEESRTEVEKAVNTFARWMQEGTIVRVIGAGRARLAATMPANRLAHGGARVYVQGDVIPLPHTINGGGIIASSASGKTPSVLTALSGARQETKDVVVVGIAAVNAAEFRSYCDIFIGIQPETTDRRNPLRALADNEEYVISELLDAMVAAAGRLAGFTRTWWQLGHENLGQETGPYDYKRNRR